MRPNRGRRREHLRRLRRRAERAVLPIVLSRAGWKIRLCRDRAGPFAGRPAHALRGAGRQRQRHLSGRTRDPRHPPGALLQRIRLGLRAVYRPAPDHADIQRRGRGHRLGRRHPDTAGQLRRIHCGRAKDLGHRGPGAASGALGSLLLSVAEICPAHHRQPEALPAGGNAGARHILRHLRGGRARGVPARPGAEPTAGTGRPSAQHRGTVRPVCGAEGSADRGGAEYPALLHRRARDIGNTRPRVHQHEHGQEAQPEHLRETRRGLTGRADALH